MRYVSAELGERNQAAFEGKRLILESTSDSPFFTVTAAKSAAAAARALGVAGAALDDAKDEVEGAADDDDATFVEVLQASQDASRKREVFFKDWSARTCNGAWTRSEVFWSVVKRDVVQALRATKDAKGRSLLHG